ncbi:FKBP-type peptidyl-prolyl cis-trans isomerase [Spirosomataceae bacterium TFI 002]|nr:FKBP-type peptidyl-prolyl cis-trans isomerase [Spirosomataceae bacterium TFI 002]
MKFKLIVFILFTAFAFTSCDSDGVPRKEDNNINEYIAAKKLVVTQTTESGLRYIRTQESPNGATLQQGQKVTVNYAGRLLTDEEFDAGTFKFTLGVGQVVGGFDIGISLMKVGEKATIIFPSTLGYGSSKQGSIPKNSPLVFDVEVLKAE